jgi:hypothetical protein
MMPEREGGADGEGGKKGGRERGGEEGREGVVATFAICCCSHAPGNFGRHDLTNPRCQRH